MIGIITQIIIACFILYRLLKTYNAEFLFEPKFNQGMKFGICFGFVRTITDLIDIITNKSSYITYIGSGLDIIYIILLAKVIYDNKAKTQWNKILKYYIFSYITIIISTLIFANDISYTNCLKNYPSLNETQCKCYKDTLMAEENMKKLNLSLNTKCGFTLDRIGEFEDCKKTGKSAEFCNCFADEVDIKSNYHTNDWIKKINEENTKEYDEFEELLRKCSWEGDNQLF
ncbi:MAG: hypothetical protein Ta2D_11880 [Rickettsiales bacterium]|nr:MAG: hypothetical protein Ta2D_11880 [Rickettsiales bacterium]